MRLTQEKVSVPNQSDQGQKQRVQAVAQAQQSEYRKRPRIVASGYKLQYNQKGFSPFFATEPVFCHRTKSSMWPESDQNDFFSEDKLMNKLIAILIAGTFALGSVAAMAQVPAGDKTPAQPVDQKALKAEKDAKKAAEAKKTPEEKAADKKAKRAARQAELAATQKSGQEGGASPQAKAADAAKAAADSKAQPKALPDAKAKQDALKEQTKKASGQ